MELNLCAREKAHWWILGVWFYLAPTELLVSSLHFSRAGTEASDKAGSVSSCSMKDALRKGISQHLTLLLLKVKISRFIDESEALPHLLSQLLSLFLFCCCTFPLCWYSQSLTPHPEKAVAPHSSTLAWKIPWMEEPGRLQSMGSLSWTWLSNFTFTFHFHALEKEMATHSSVLAWRIPGTGEPGGQPSMGSHKVRHD